MNKVWCRNLIFIVGALLMIACTQDEATTTAFPPSSTEIPAIPAASTATTQLNPTSAPTDIPQPTVVPTPTIRPTAQPTPTPVPRPTPLPDDLLQPAGADLNLPEGFKAEVWLEGIRFPTAFAFDDQNRLYIANELGDLVRVNDANSGEPPTDVVTVSSGIEVPLGLAFFDGALYVSSRGEITRITDEDGDGELDSFKTIVNDIPVPGNHQNNGPAVGPDGKLYVPIGSSCDACGEEDVRSASVTRFDLDGSNQEVFARGLRNVYQLAFHPEDGTLWAADNGRDDKGYAVPEELNLVVEGGAYGYPDCWGTNGGRRCEGTIPPVAELPSRSSADGLVFYTGDQFPSEYTNDIFITLWGTGDGSTGKNVVRIVLTTVEDRYTARVSNFATGFKHPLPIIVSPDGSLLIGNHGAGTVLRVFYTGF